MSPEQIRVLWSRYLAGQEISAEEQRELVDAMESDPELRESLVENLQLDGVLKAMNATRRHGESFVRTLSDCLGAEHDATRFVQKVELRLNQPEPPPTATAGTTRRSKPSTTRIFKRRPAPSTPGETAWKPALIAAAGFAVILLLVTDFKSETRRPVVATTKERPPVVVEKHVTPPATPVTPEEARNVAEDLRRLQRLAEIEREQQHLRTTPPTPNEKPEDRQRAIAASEVERLRIESELRDASAKRERQIREPQPGKSAPETMTAKATVATTVVEKVDGDVYIARSKTDKRRPKVGETVPAGHDIEIPLSGSVVLRLEDGTRVELGPQSSFREMAAGAGLRLFLAYGSLQSVIAKQPADRPLVFATPHAEAAILGTTIRLTVSPDPKVGSNLEVKEGKVRFTRLSDFKPVDVVAGHFAVAAAGVELAPQKNFPDEILVRFGPGDIQVKPGQVLDSGDEFDPVRGYGWKGPKVGPFIPGLFWRDGAGQLQPKMAGRQAVRRTTAPEVDPLKTTDVVAGWAGQTETWFMPVPNGRYLVSVCCGDYTWEQGPHHVWVEGVQLIDQKKNKVREFIQSPEVIVDVKDGELTMKVGGNPGSRKSSDGSTDTIINFLIIKKLKK